MYETNRKSTNVNWSEEVTVNVTLKELAILYSLLCYTSTSDAQSKVDNKIPAKIDVYEGDIPYKMYDDTRVILEANGAKVYT
jgi:hypothetical protein